MSEPISEINPLDQLAEEFVERYRQGDRPPLSEYVDRYPELADEIRDLFPGLMLMEGVRPETGEATGAYTDTIPSGVKLERLGDYRILREVGRGGMGIVYEAEQESLGRHVALKVMPGQMLLDPHRLRRFEREARSAAKLHHTNIVPVYGVGCNDGLHYYIMQFIQGQGLDQVLDELKRLRHDKSAVPAPCSCGSGAVSAAEVAQAFLTGQSQSNGRQDGFSVAMPPTEPPECALVTDSSIHLPGNASASTLTDTGQPYWQSVARLGIQVADALGHAHAQGTLHRDIKPSNLLLDGQGNVWVTDFGLAKASADADNLTHTGDIVGTLRYMAPERYQGQSDARGDIYSLGLTLYEMLVLRPAFRAGDRNKLIQQVMHDEPEQPRKLNPAVPHDLETIVLKAIDRNPALRYQTAAELAADLTRFVEDRPIQARRVSLPERLRRWRRRNPAIAGLSAALTLVFLAGFVGVAWKWHEAERQKDTTAEQRKIAVEQADRSRHLLYISDMNLAQQAWEAGDNGRALDLLERQLPQDGQEDLRGFEWRYLWSLCQDGCRDTLPGHAGKVAGVAFSPNGQMMATCGGDVRLWDLGTRQHVHIVGTFVESATFWPDGKTLIIHEAGAVSVWDIAGRRERLRVQLPPATVTALSRDNLLAVGSHEGIVHFWDLTTGQELGAHVKGHTGAISQVVFSPDGRTLASGGADGKICLWDVAAGRLSATFEGHTAYVNSLAFSPDGKLLASSGNDTTIRLWDIATKRQVKRLWNQRTALTLVACYEPLQSLAFAADGHMLATGGGDGTIRLWDVESMEVVAMLRGHTAAVAALAIAPDGRSLVSGSYDGAVKVWDLAPKINPNVLTGHKANLSSLAFSDDGQTLAVADSLDQTVKLWNLASREVAFLEGHTAHLWRLAFSPGSQILASTSVDGTIRLWDTAGKKQLEEFRLPNPNTAGSVAYSPDGKLLAAGIWPSNAAVRVWDLVSRKQVAELTPGCGYRVQFSPDGSLLAAGHGKTVQFWDVATWQNVGALSGHSAEVLSFAFAPDGRTLAVGTADGTLCLWDVAQKLRIASRRGHTSNVEFIAFSSDGRRLATCGADGTARLWDVALLQEVAILTGHDGPVNCLAFTPDGNTLATASADATVRLWNAPMLPAALHEPVKISYVQPVETISLFAFQLFFGANGRLTRDGDVYQVDVTAVDGTNWHAQLIQMVEDLQEGATYTVRFRAKGDAERQVNLHGQIAEPDYHGIGLDEAVPLTKEWREYRYEFQAKNLAAGNSILFNVGDRAGKVWIADFTLTRSDQ